jgi:hypothetical protein
VECVVSLGTQIRRTAKMNFEGMDRRLRDRVHWATGDLLGKVVRDHLLKGGKFDRTKMTQMFYECVRTAQLIEDLYVGTGLNPLEKEGMDEVSDNGTGNPEGLAGSDGAAGRVCYTPRPADTVDDNRAAGSREIDVSELEPPSPKSGPGTRG